MTLKDERPASTENVKGDSKGNPLMMVLILDMLCSLSFFLFLFKLGLLLGLKKQQPTAPFHHSLEGNMHRWQLHLKVSNDKLFSVPDMLFKKSFESMLFSHPCYSVSLLT